MPTGADTVTSVPFFGFLSSATADYAIVTVKMPDADQLIVNVPADDDWFEPKST